MSREQLARVEIYRVKVHRGGELSDDGEADPDDREGAAHEGVDQQHRGAEHEADDQGPPPAKVGKSEEMSKQVCGDLGNHEQREVYPEVAVEAGGGEVDAVVANVGGEPEDAHDDQPQPEGDGPGPGDGRQLRGGEGTKSFLSDHFSICFCNIKDDSPRSVKFIPSNEPPSKNAMI